MRIKGFLAILLLVVVVVFFLYVIKAGNQQQLPAQIEAFDSMKDKLTRTNLVTLERVITSYMAQAGETPRTLKDLDRFHLISAARVDAWGKAIKYERLSESRFRLVSAGKDRLFKTDDDIISEY